MLFHAISTDNRAVQLMPLGLDHTKRTDYLQTPNIANIQMFSPSELSQYSTCATDRSPHMLSALTFTPPLTSPSTMGDLLERRASPSQQNVDSRNKLLTCKLCSFSSTWPFDLKQHFKKKHNIIDAYTQKTLMLTSST